MVALRLSMLSKSKVKQYNDHLLNSMYRCATITVAFIIDIIIYYILDKPLVDLTDESITNRYVDLTSSPDMVNILSVFL